MYVGRLAPSPTGAQHVGNARTFLVAWLRCRLASGRLLLRIEDLDTPRTKSGAAEQAVEDLRWLGLDWDESESGQTALQSQRTERYSEVLELLKSKELVYPCVCTRSEIESSASAPHESLLDGVIYPGTCQCHYASDAAALSADGKRFAWRFRMPSGEMQWHDELFGGQCLEPRSALGDFVVARSYGEMAYQLAVVVDDHDSGVSEVVRGADLIYSTYRQLVLYEALGWTPPNWLHVPLVVGTDGKRLAKRHGDTRLATLRASGLRAEELIGHLVVSLGWSTRYREISAIQLLDMLMTRSDWLSAIPKTPWVFSEKVMLV